MTTPQPYRVVVRHEAEVDITEAAVWYHNQSAGLGHDFLADVDVAVAVAAAAANPFQFPCLRRKPEVPASVDEALPVSSVLRSPR